MCPYSLLIGHVFSLLLFSKDTHSTILLDLFKGLAFGFIDFSYYFSVSRIWICNICIVSLVLVALVLICLCFLLLVLEVWIGCLLFFCFQHFRFFSVCSAED
jgi:hypothetical protein